MTNMNDREDYKPADVRVGWQLSTRTVLLSMREQSVRLSRAQALRLADDIYEIVPEGAPQETKAPRG